MSTADRLIFGMFVLFLLALASCDVLAGRLA
jgi:hypothetical protein